MRPLALGLSAAWAAWRLLALDRALAQRRAWHHAPGWMVAPEALPAETTPSWWPGWSRRWRSQGHRHRGSCWDGPFAGRPGTRRCWKRRWPPTVPCRRPRTSRGGHPALHAVGQETEQPLVVPWSELVGHVLVTGTTRSGKTRLLEVLASEAIRGPGAVVDPRPQGGPGPAGAVCRRSPAPGPAVCAAHPGVSRSSRPASTSWTPRPPPPKCRPASGR